MGKQKELLARIKLRSITMSDKTNLVKYANNKNVAANLRDSFPHPYLEKHAIEFINSATDGADNKLILAIDLDGGLIGCIGGYIRDDVYERSCEIGYWLGEPFWCKGIATEMIKRFVPIIFDRFDVVRIYAEPYDRNIASHRALEKAGFNKEIQVQYNMIKNNVVEGSFIYSFLRSRQ